MACPDSTVCGYSPGLAIVRVPGAGIDAALAAAAESGSQKASGGTHTGSPQQVLTAQMLPAGQSAEPPKHRISPAHGVCPSTQTPSPSEVVTHTGDRQVLGSLQGRKVPQPAPSHSGFGLSGPQAAWSSMATLRANWLMMHDAQAASIRPADSASSTA